MSLSETDQELVTKIVALQLHPKRKGKVSEQAATRILEFMRVPAMERISLAQLGLEIGLSKTKIYTVINDYKELGIPYKSIPTGFKGVNQRRRAASERLD